MGKWWRYLSAAGKSQASRSVVASRLRAINFSQTLAMGRRGAELRRSGRDIISLGLGELDLEIPRAIREAAAAAALRGEGRSSLVQGIEALRTGICRKLARDNGLAYDLSEIIVASGTKQVIFNAMMATLDAGDEVLIPAPYWVSYPDIVRLAGGEPIAILCGPEVGHKLTAEHLEAAITPRTRWLFLNSPNNPTGSVYTRDELASLASVLRRHQHVMTLSDDIYELFVYTPAPFVSLASIAPDLKDRILVVNGFSKSFAMIGWRIGYGAGCAPLIEAMVRVQSQITSGTSTIVQAGAVAAIDASLNSVASFQSDYLKRRDRTAKLIDAIPGLIYVRPEGAFYFYPTCDAYIGRRTPEGRSIDSDNDLAEFLLETANVVTIPGSAFGLGPALRLSYTCPENRIEEAFCRIGDALSQLR